MRWTMLVLMTMGCTGAWAGESSVAGRLRECVVCHAASGKGGAPTWQAVAARYRGNAEAHIFLPAKIMSGGAGIWGKTAMPAQKMTYDEARELSDYILNQPSREASVRAMSEPSS